MKLRLASSSLLDGAVLWLARVAAPAQRERLDTEDAAAKAARRSAGIPMLDMVTGALTFKYE